MGRESAPGSLKNFFSGAALLFRGVIFFLQNRPLWKYALLPLAVTCVVYVFTAWALFACSGFLSDQIGELCSTLPAYLSWLVYPCSVLLYLLSVIVLGLIVIFCSGTVYEVASGPFLDLLVEKITMDLEQKETGGNGAYHLPSQSWKFILKSIWDVLNYNLCSILLLLLLLLAGFLTVGVIIPFTIPVLIALFMGYRLGVSFLAVPGFCYGKSFAEIRQYASRNKALITGFGTTVYLLYWIPFGLILLLPGTVCAAVLLFSRFREESKVSS